jgi:3-methyladenine DNA glycosylase AlkC
MPELLKNIYNHTFFDHFTAEMESVVQGFDRNRFMDLVLDEGWEQRELKDRMKHIAFTLEQILPLGFEEACEKFVELTVNVRSKHEGKYSLEYMFLPEYVARYGLEQFDCSVETMEEITKLTSCEFAVRPFIVEHKGSMMNRMAEWSQHDNHHVRRLASEGCRPRLPWAMALPIFKKNPEPILPILENLKGDTSEYVRRSVANNLNDISKDNPDVVLEIANKWKGRSEETDRILKHGARTLLKKANPYALELFGFPQPDDIEVNTLALKSDVIEIGEKLDFSFEVVNYGKKTIQLRIEYGIDYMKSNGTQNRKLFKVTEYGFQPGEKREFDRSQSFKNLTTRKHYNGEHGIAIVVNGREMIREKFVVGG